MNRSSLLCPSASLEGLFAVALASLTLWAIGATVPVDARADGGAIWRYAPAISPSPPAGVPAAPYPVPLGEVGQISFWAPNRGLLITGGTQSEGGPVAPGLFAYDGVNWHQLATVCGGSEGRIAWSGPDEFWTISDQRAGQVGAREESLGELRAVSLCHFLNGQVVGSYAMPLGRPSSYLKMDGAACVSPSDCWFGGQTGQPPANGAFHLHWDGSTVSVVYDAEDHAVTGMVNFGGRVYEGLAIGAGDSYLGGENAQHPAVMRTIAPAGQTPLCNGIPSVFCDVFAFSTEPLPIYGERILPDALGGFSVTSDGAPLGQGATQLWAAADPLVNPPVGSAAAALTVLRDTHGSWSQVLPTTESSETLPAGSVLSGGASDSLAPEPGSSSAWLSLAGPGEDAQVALLGADGRVAERDILPGPEDPVGPRGTAGPIVCPAAHDCWMATDPTGKTAGGWLFHLTNGSNEPQDTDPNFASVMSYRPPDPGVSVIYPDLPPVDDSLANQALAVVPSAPPQQAPPAAPKSAKRRALVLHVKSKFLHRRLLVLSFTLTARARVQLVGSRNRRVVAKTPERSLAAGAHTLSLGFDPKHWPTKIQFKANPAQTPGPSTGVSGGSNSSNTVTTG
jgi:hypothetical protein